MVQNSFMSSLVLKDAYYSVPVQLDFQKFLKLRWNNKHFQYTVMPNGLACAPRLFTKLLKPASAKLQQSGHTICGYLDDIYIQDSNYDKSLEK